ncbi:MAG: hypothetical protein FWD97_01105 [Defluviitaleaceae bacterium]|nr:hypothetical protein [Defluviitaleaceae bacterium]
MPVFRTEKVSDYAVIAKHHLKNKALSYKAKGLMTFMLSVPPCWDWSMAGLATLASDGIDGVRSGIRELEKHSYLSRRRIRDESGRLGDIEYTIHEIPQNLLDNEPNRMPEVALHNPHMSSSTSTNLDAPAYAAPLNSPSNLPISDYPPLATPALESPSMASPTQARPTSGKPTLDMPSQALPAQDNAMQRSNDLVSINKSSINKSCNKIQKQSCASLSATAQARLL